MCVRMYLSLVHLMSPTYQVEPVLLFCLPFGTRSNHNKTIFRKHLVSRSQLQNQGSFFWPLKPIYMPTLYVSIAFGNILVFCPMDLSWIFVRDSFVARHRNLIWLRYGWNQSLYFIIYSHPFLSSAFSSLAWNISRLLSPGSRESSWQHQAYMASMPLFQKESACFSHISNKYGGK